jgi:hypothetical protein
MDGYTKQWRSFPIEGDELHDGLSCPGKEIIGEFSGNGYEDVRGYASLIIVQDERDVEKLFEDFKIKNGADRFIDPDQGEKGDLPPIVYNTCRATATTEGVPRTTIHQLTPEKIESRVCAKPQIRCRRYIESFGCEEAGNLRKMWKSMEERLTMLLRKMKCQRLKLDCVS